MSENTDHTTPALEWKLIIGHQPMLAYSGTEQCHYYETEEAAALAEYGRLDDILRRKRARENDVPNEVEVVSCDGRATYPVDNLHLIRVVNAKLFSDINNRADIEHAINKAQALKSLGEDAA